MRLPNGYGCWTEHILQSTYTTAYYHIIFRNQASPAEYIHNCLWSYHLPEPGVTGWSAVRSLLYKMVQILNDPHASEGMASLSVIMCGNCWYVGSDKSYAHVVLNLWDNRIHSATLPQNIHAIGKEVHYISPRGHPIYINILLSSHIQSPAYRICIAVRLVWVRHHHLFLSPTLSETHPYWLNIHYATFGYQILCRVTVISVGPSDIIYVCTGHSQAFPRLNASLFGPIRKILYRLNDHSPDLLETVVTFDLLGISICPFGALVQMLIYWAHPSFVPI